MKNIYEEQLMDNGIWQKYYEDNFIVFSTQICFLIIYFSFMKAFLEKAYIFLHKTKSCTLFINALVVISPRSIFNIFLGKPHYLYSSLGDGKNLGEDFLDRDTSI